MQTSSIRKISQGFGDAEMVPVAARTVKDIESNTTRKGTDTSVS